MTTTLPEEGSSFMPMPGNDPPRPCDVNIYNHSVIRQHTNKLNAVQLPRNNKARLTLQTGSHHSKWSTLISAPIYFYCTLSENIESLWRSDKANIPAFPYSPTVVLVEVTDDVLLRRVVGASDDRATWLRMLRRREGGGMGSAYRLSLSRVGSHHPTHTALILNPVLSHSSSSSGEKQLLRKAITNFRQQCRSTKSYLPDRKT